jgi:hypothetical protein
MLYQNATSELPDPDSKIWRYMDFTKLVFTIDNEALYFTSIDNLDDPFEGSLTRINIEDRRKIISLLENNKLIKVRNTGKSSNHEDLIRNNIFVNSWHINEEESAAMWKLYLKSDEGVAIQSTIERLKSNLNKFNDQRGFL